MIKLLPKEIEDGLALEDVRQAIEDNECVRCGEELSLKLLGDEYYPICSECGTSN